LSLWRELNIKSATTIKGTISFQILTKVLAREKIFDPKLLIIIKAQINLSTQQVLNSQK
jgi:hypothetical protein